nr:MULTISPECIES: transposase [Burkholderia]
MVGRKRNGRREFDEAARQELVELCLKPGVSIVRAAMDHDVNPNHDEAKSGQLNLTVMQLFMSIIYLMSNH